MSGINLCACSWAEYEHDPAEHQPNHSRTSLLDELRDSLAMRLHGELCDGRHDDRDGPCWTAWRTEADLLMPDVRRALTEAWGEGARSGAIGFVERQRQNPYKRATVSGVNRPRVCDLCYGNHGWTGHYGVWEPCPKCDPPTEGGAA